MSYIELKDVTKLYSDGNVKAADGVSFSYSSHLRLCFPF